MADYLGKTMLIHELSPPLAILNFNIMTYHILPINDLEEHEELSTCKCLPKTEILESGDILIIHNSFDGREAVELANEIINKK